jgi:hypothetical protein
MMDAIRSSEMSSQRASVATASFVPSSLILFTLMMEAIVSSETLVRAGATRCNFLECGVLSGIILILVGR